MTESYEEFEREVTAGPPFGNMAAWNMWDILEGKENATRKAIDDINTFPYLPEQMENLQQWMIERGFATVFDFTVISRNEKLHNILNAFPPRDSEDEIDYDELERLHRVFDEWVDD